MINLIKTRCIFGKYGPQNQNGVYEKNLLNPTSTVGVTNISLIF